MAKLKAADVKKGMVLEAVKSTVDVLEHLVPEGSDPFDVICGAVQPIPIVAGRKYKVLKDCKKYGGSALMLYVEDLSTGKRGSGFWTYYGSVFKEDSPSPAPKAEGFSASDQRLNDGEEYVIVRKGNPAMAFAGIDFPGRSTDKSDVVEGNLAFSPKIGRRKRFKNLQALTGFLHNSTGCLDRSAWYLHFQSKPNKDRSFNLRGLNNMPDWVGGAKESQSFGLLELRKYDCAARKVLPQAVDFEIAGYCAKFEAAFHLTYLYGPAVSQCISKALEQESAARWVFWSKFDPSKFSEAWEAPEEKDIYVDLALKALGIKKKDALVSNDKGFAAVAFETREQAEQFMAAYKKEPDKVAGILDMESLDPSADLAPIRSWFAQQRKAAAKAAAEAEDGKAVSPDEAAPAGEAGGRPAQKAGKARP